MITKFLNFINEGRVPPDERIKLLEDDNYLVVVPLTDKASYKYGAYTNWCISAPNSERSISSDGINRVSGENIIVFLLNKKYNKSKEIPNKYRELYVNCAIGKTPYKEVTEFIKTHGNDIYDLSKIAFEYDVRTNEIILWSANNIDMTEDDFSIDNITQLGIDKYVIDIISKYINDIKTN